MRQSVELAGPQAGRGLAKRVRVFICLHISRPITRAHEGAWT